MTAVIDFPTNFTNNDVMIFFCELFSNNILIAAFRYKSYFIINRTLEIQEVYSGSLYTVDVLRHNMMTMYIRFLTINKEYHNSCVCS